MIYSHVLSNFFLLIYLVKLCMNTCLIKNQYKKWIKRSKLSIREFLSNQINYACQSIRLSLKLDLLMIPGIVVFFPVMTVNTV
jgi:hypothetical protein